MAAAFRCRQSRRPPRTAKRPPTVHPKRRSGELVGTVGLELARACPNASAFPPPSAVTAGRERREPGQRAGGALQVPGQRLARCRERDVALAERALETEDRGIREFVLGEGVLPGGLAERRRGLRDIEEVVGDLEEEPERFPVSPDEQEPALVRARVERPELEATGG